MTSFLSLNRIRSDLVWLLSGLCGLYLESQRPLLFSLSFRKSTLNIVLMSVLINSDLISLWINPFCYSCVIKFPSDLALNVWETAYDIKHLTYNAPFHKLCWHIDMDEAVVQLVLNITSWTPWKFQYSDSGLWRAKTAARKRRRSGSCVAPAELCGL